MPLGSPAAAGNPWKRNADVTSPDSSDTRRAAARRTAWWVAGIAFGVYALFIYMGATAAR